MHDDTLTSAPHRDAQPGEIVAFGAYPHTAGGADRTPVQWRVLHNSGGELFLLSEHILECKRYHGEYAPITWRDCDLRRWLNGDFYEAAFDAAEKAAIKMTLCTDNGEGSPDTEDRVFLPGVVEMKGLMERYGKEIGRARGTAFARAEKADGCRLYVYDKGVAWNYVLEDGEKVGCSWWWLRTQLGDPSRATFMGTGSSIRSYGRVNLRYYGVRPALKLSL